MMAAQSEKPVVPYFCAGVLTPEGEISWKSIEFGHYFDTERTRISVSETVLSKHEQACLQVERIFSGARLEPMPETREVKIMLPMGACSSPEFHMTIHEEFEGFLMGLFAVLGFQERMDKFLEFLNVSTSSTVSCFFRCTDDSEFTTYISDPYREIADRAVFASESTGKVREILEDLAALPVIPETPNLLMPVPEISSRFEHGRIFPCVMDTKIYGALIIYRNNGAYTTGELDSAAHLAKWLCIVVRADESQDEYRSILAKKKLQQQMESTATFADGIAHDINNLLSGMFGGIELLGMKIIDPELTRLLGIVQSSAHKVRELSRGLLDRGKQQRKRFRTFLPTDLLDEIEKFCQHSFPPGIKFMVRQDTPLLQVFGDYTQLYQVVMNLIVNAREAIGEEGFVYVNARNTKVFDENMAEYPLLEKGDYIHFSVQDTGPGIAKENLNKIFEPYFSTKGKKGGSGLGLSNVYSIVKSHKGTIEVESQPGRGARFDVYIPAIRQPVTQKEQIFPIIVLVDDDLALQELLAELLESQGYQVICFADGKEALTFLTEEIKPDLVILDYHLPGMNGIELIMSLRGNGNLVPVLLTSGDSAIENTVIKLSSVGVDTLEKPYEFETLINLVEARVQRP